MHWQDLYKSIEGKTFSGICLMHGLEEYLKDVAIDKAIALNVPAGLEDINITKITSDDIKRIKETINMPPFMAEKRIVIIDGYKKFYANKNQYKTEDTINIVDEFKEILSREYIDSCIFFLCRGKVDSTNPLYKLFKKQDLAVSYDRVTETEKTDMLLSIAKQKGVDINASAINFLQRYTNADLLVLENELDKLDNFKDGKITVGDIEAVCHASTDYNVFNMIKAIDAKREQDALKILKDMLRGGEYIGGIVSLIERQYRVFAFIEDMEKEYHGRINFAEMEKRLGVKSFVIEKMYRQGKNMDKEKRDNILRMCTDADYLAKRGRINDVVALESLVIKLMAQ